MNKTEEYIKDRANELSKMHFVVVDFERAIVGFERVITEIISDTKKVFKRKIEKKRFGMTYDKYAEGDGTFDDGYGHALEWAEHAIDEAGVTK